MTSTSLAAAWWMRLDEACPEDTGADVYCRTVQDSVIAAKKVLGVYQNG
ncbi:MAG: hypothetical protein M1380_10145 [Chloroflexi bacterium]|nr:hypothetical protein [Chloroflexota bacterium]MCL5734960.1 hypothetical protein [Actinomycetota bacterium]